MCQEWLLLLLLFRLPLKRMVAHLCFGGNWSDILQTLCHDWDS